MFTPRPLQRTLAAALRDLTSQRADVRASAAHDLALAGQDAREPSADALEPLLGDAVPIVRGEAALALGVLGAYRHMKSLSVLLYDTSSQVRQYAVMALGQLGGPEAAEILEQSFEHACEDVRYQTLIVLAQVSPQRCYELALRAVADQDVWISSEAAMQLPELVEVHPSLGGPDEPWATEAERARAREALRARLEGSSGRVALCAALSLARLGDGRGNSFITAFVHGHHRVESADDTAELYREAIERLGELGGVEACAALRLIAWRWLPSEERDLARIALARLGDRRACATILGELRSVWEARRRNAARLAGEARLSEAVPYLIAQLGSGRSSATIAATALGLIGGVQARSALEKLVQSSTNDVELSTAAQQALEHLLG